MTAMQKGEGIGGENGSRRERGGTIAWLAEEEDGGVGQKIDESRRSAFSCS